MEERHALTERIIGCAIEVHRELGPGLLESAYETPLCIQLAKTGLKFEHLKITGLRRGLILNFNKAVLKAGIKRVTPFD